MLFSLLALLKLLKLQEVTKSSQSNNLQLLPLSSGADGINHGTAVLWLLIPEERWEVGTGS